MTSAFKVTVNLKKLFIIKEVGNLSPRREP